MGGSPPGPSSAGLTGRACPYPTCHTWGHADISVTTLIPGRWALIPAHGTPLTSQDGTTDTASGGEYRPQLEADTAALEGLARPQDGG
jgi:hypothetical protein